MPGKTPCVDCGELSDKRSERCISCEYKRRQERACEVIEDGIRCTGAHKSNGMCDKHYQRYRKHRSPLTNVRDAHRAFVRRAAWMDTDECIIPPWYSGERCVVRVDGVRRTAARQAWIERYGDPGDRLVLHDCSDGSGDSGCINVRHLRLGNDADNNRDRNDAGRTVLPDVRGEAHGNAKLDREAVREIRDLAASGMSHDAIAERYPVGRRTITNIVARQTWAWLDAPDEEPAAS